MEKKCEIKSESLILVEFYRFLRIVRDKNPDGFDMFENDVFMIYDPISDDKECTCGALDDAEVGDANDNNNDELSEKKNSKILDELKDDVIFSEEDVEYENEDASIRNMTIAVANSIYSSFSYKHFPQFIGIKPIVHDSDCLLEIPNFHYKPTDLKLWYDDENEKLFSNKSIKFREFSSILLTCIASLGRRTSEFLNRGFMWIDGYLDINRELSEKDEESLEWLYKEED